jgi:hypothetical protein
MCSSSVCEQLCLLCDCCITILLSFLMMRAVPHMSLYLQDVSLNSWLILQCTVCGIKRSYSELSVWRTTIYFVFSAQNARNNARWGFEVMTTLTILMLVFYIVTSYGLVLKMEAVCSSETLISTYIFTRCYNPEDQHGHTIKKSCLLSVDIISETAEQVSIKFGFGCPH